MLFQRFKCQVERFDLTEEAFVKEIGRELSKLVL